MNMKARNLILGLLGIAVLVGGYFIYSGVTRPPTITLHQWQLTSFVLRGDELQTFKQYTIVLTFDPQSSLARSNSPCHNMRFRYKVVGSHLSLSLAEGLSYEGCYLTPDDRYTSQYFQDEWNYLNVMEDVQGYQIQGNILTLNSHQANTFIRYKSIT